MTLRMKDGTLYGSWWDNAPFWVRVGAGVALAIFIFAGLLGPLFMVLG